MPGSTLPQTDTQSRTRLPADQLDVADRAESEVVRLSDGVRIHRTRHERDFTILSNHLIRDPNLGPFAVGVLARILSNVGNWHVTAKSMWEEGRKRGRKESRNDYQNAFTEMELAGYMTRQRLSVPNDNGRGNKMITDVHYYDVALPESRRTSYAATGKKRSSENQTPVVGTTCGNTTNAQVVPTTTSRFSGPPAETRKSPGRSENRQSDVIKKEQEIKLCTESSSPLRGEPHDDEAAKINQDSGEGSSAPVGEGAGRDRVSGPNPPTSSATTAGAPAAPASAGTSSARPTGKDSSSAPSAQRQSSQTSDRRENRGPDEFDKLAQEVADKIGQEYQPRYLAPRFREVAGRFGINADAVRDAVCCWIGDYVPGFTGPNVTKSSGEAIVKNPGGFLHNYLPDIFRWFVPTRAEKAAEVGAVADTFNLLRAIRAEAAAEGEDVPADELMTKVKAVRRELDELRGVSETKQEMLSIYGRHNGNLYRLLKHYERELQQAKETASTDQECAGI